MTPIAPAISAANPQQGEAKHDAHAVEDQQGHVARISAREMGDTGPKRAGDEEDANLLGDRRVVGAGDYVFEFGFVHGEEVLLSPVHRSVYQSSGDYAFDKPKDGALGTRAES